MTPKTKLLLYKVIGFLMIAYIAYALCSCITEKKRAKICASCPTLIDIKDSIHEVVRIKDTTIYISQKGDSIFVPCDTTSFKRVYKKNGLRLTISKNKNGIVAECDSDSLKKVIEKINKEVDRSSKKTETKVVTTERPLSKFDIFCRLFFFASIILYSIKFYLHLR